jgi:hypothetical protein
VNDPHVVALGYRVECDEGFDYHSASQLAFQTDRFICRIDDGRARFEFKPAAHHARVEEAQEEIDRFAEAWKISAEIKHWPGAFRLVYDPSRNEIVDRNPPMAAGYVFTLGRASAVVTGSAMHFKRSFGSYPDPPMNFEVSDDLRKTVEVWRAA